MMLLKTFFLFLFIFYNTLYASTSSKIKITDASEKIKLLSQKISKEYTYYYRMQKSKNLSIQIKNDVQLLDENIRIIASISKDEKIKRILGFFDYEKENFLESLSTLPTKDLLSNALDFSESISEGAFYLATYASYDYSREEKMILVVKHVEFLSEKFLKYYVALSSDINKISLEDDIRATLHELEINIADIKQYNYPEELVYLKTNLDAYLNLYKKLHMNINTDSFPTIAMIAGNGFHETVDHLSVYHRKNQ